jgi:RimJ/RimL family protein N-acetyltransferase
MACSWARQSSINLTRTNESADYCVWLAGPQLFGQGYGTEITRLVLDFALGTVGLHQVSLGVYDFNLRPNESMRSAVFVMSAVCARRCAGPGQWHDELLMAIPHNDPWPEG